MHSMLIPLESPLRRLPAALPPRQLLHFDAIRTACEISETAYTRLHFSAKRIATETLTREQLRTIISEILCDAWTIVDSTHRLSKLVPTIPGFKKKASSVQLFMRRTVAVEVFRHAIQHLDKQLDALATARNSVWGTIRWFQLLDAGARKIAVHTLITGSQIGEMHTLVPAFTHGVEMHDGIDQIVLTSYNSELNLSAMMRATAEYARALQSHLDVMFTEQFQGAETAPTEFVFSAHVVLLGKGEKGDGVGRSGPPLFSDTTKRGQSSPGGVR
jgi:hypothetical protein